MKRDIELLAPAGNLEKLKTAVLYGADAVYCGGYNFGLRAGADNFTLEDLQAGISYAHQHGSKVYLTLNMIPHNDDLAHLPEYLQELKDLALDAVIVADPGVFTLVKKYLPKMHIHISTQANNLNWASVNFWQEMGAERVILARELSQTEIEDIEAKTDTELEMFVHGAMCISYSGRCLLSNYLIGRDANRGDCAHSCRWKYHLVEEKRPDDYYPITENEQGTFIMNSRDLCLIEFLPEVIGTGVNSLKIEGRMKSVHYVATIINVYRQAIDAYLADPASYHFDPAWLEELEKVSHRSYTTGFFTGKPGPAGQRYESASYLRSYDFMGVVKSYDQAEKEALVEVRNKFFVNDLIEFAPPSQKPFSVTINYIIDQKTGEKIENAPHPKQLIKLPVQTEVKPGTILRREKEVK